MAFCWYPEFSFRLPDAEPLADALRRLAQQTDDAAVQLTLELWNVAVSGSASLIGTGCVPLRDMVKPLPTMCETGIGHGGSYTQSSILVDMVYKEHAAEKGASQKVPQFRIHL